MKGQGFCETVEHIAGLNLLIIKLNCLAFKSLIFRNRRITHSMSHAKTNLGLQNPPSTGKGSRKQPLTNLESRIRRAYSDYCEAESAKLQIKRLWKLISLCHNNQRAQKELLKVLNLP